MTYKKTALLCGTTLGIVFSMAATVAMAQPASTAGATATAEEGTEVGELVVVGSRIRRDTYSTPAPVQVISREESTMAGFSSTTDVLQSNAVTAGGAQINNAFGGFVTQGGPGSNTLGLRGLGASRTLVLVNGRRLSPAGTRGATAAPDLNVLPNVSVDRIEVLKDGASSIYGSDAIAGVVNVITRRNVEGLEIEGDYHYADKDAGSNYRASILGGFTADKFHIQASLDYYHRTELTLGDRDWTLCNQDLRINKATGASLDYIDPNTGQSKCYPITNTNGSNGVTINTIGIGGFRTVAGQIPGVPANTLILAVPGFPAATIGPGLSNVTAGGNGDCSPIGAPAGRPAEEGRQPYPGTTLYCFNRFRPNSAVTTGIVGYEAVGGGSNQQNTNLNVRDTFEPRMLNKSLISPTTNYSFFTEGTYDLDSWHNSQVYFEILASRRDSYQTGYRQLSLDYPIGSPLIPANLLTNTVIGPIAPIGLQSPDMTKGLGTQVRAFIGFGNDHNNQRLDFFKPTLGLRGDLPKLWMWDDWRYDLTAVYSGSNGKYVQQTFLTSRLADSLDVVAAPGGGFQCRTLANNPECVAAPVLTPAVVGGDIPQAFRDYVFVRRAGNTDYWERTFMANIDGTLFNLPGGPVKGAFGYEYRRQHIDDTPSLDSQAGNFTNLTSAAITRGSDTVWELYGEVDIPVITDKPFAKKLSFDLSGRYTDYKTYGADTTYKVTGLYQPVDWFTLRGTMGTSYRAPALFELYQGASTGFGSSQTDPCNNYGSSPDTVLVANCTSENLPNGGGFQQTQGTTIITAGNNTGTLAAETSKNFTWGFIFQPTIPDAFGRVQLAVDYVDIRVENEISRVGATNILQLCYSDPDFRAGGGYCNLVTRANNTARSLTILDGYINIATQTVRGIDYNLRYTNNIGPGTLRLDALVTQYLEQGSKTFPDDPFDEFNGSLNTPEYVGTFEAAYTWKPWKFRYELDWVKDMESYSLFGITDPSADPRIMDVPNYYLHNISVQYSSDKNNWQMTAGVRNLADKDPPIISMTGSALYPRVGNSPIYSGYDFIGRTVYVNFTKKLF